MVVYYIYKIKKNELKIEDVPSLWQEKVKQKLSKEAN